MTAHDDHQWQGLTPTPAATTALGRAVGNLARTGDLITLIGELGAGKTQFVRGLAMGMGIDPGAVSSPTFVLMQEYEPPPPEHPEAPVLVHIDAYRLQGPGELETIGWDAATAGAELRQDSVVVIEWADRVHDALGPDRLEVMLEHAGGTTRQVTLRAWGDWGDRMGKLRRRLNQELNG